MAERAESVVPSFDDGIATITFNRPGVLNAFDAGMAEEFLDVVRAIAARTDVRVVVLRGEGRAFCAGGDVSRFLDGDPRDAIEAIITPIHAALRAFDALTVPTLAAVHGAVAGAGLSLALACDLCVAADNAKFTLAFSKLGATPDTSSTYRLPRLVGLRKAKEIALLADLFDAQEAARLGLINRVVPSAEFEAETAKLARRLATGPTLAYGRIKALLEASLDSDLAGQLDAEREAFLASAGTSDFREGVAAFLAKRPARFEGR